MGVANLFINEAAGLTLDQAGELYLDFNDSDTISGQPIGFGLEIRI